MILMIKELLQCPLLSHIAKKDFINNAINFYPTFYIVVSVSQNMSWNYYIQRDLKKKKRKREKESWSLIGACKYYHFGEYNAIHRHCWVLNSVKSYLSIHSFQAEIPHINPPTNMLFHILPLNDNFFMFMISSSALISWWSNVHTDRRNRNHAAVMDRR